MTAFVGSIQHAYLPESAWIAANPVLLAGQVVFSSDQFYPASGQPKFKVGNGTSTWSQLSYMPVGVAPIPTLEDVRSTDSIIAGAITGVNAGHGLDLDNTDPGTASAMIYTPLSWVYANDGQTFMGAKNNNAGVYVNTLADGVGMFNSQNEVSVNTDGNFTINGFRVVDVANAIDPTDAMNKQQTESAISAATVGLLDDRGNYNASSNLFPSAGGSGAGGAILKGDVWTISVAGTLGGVAVSASDVLRALTDSPGQTAANWVVTENNFGYTPESLANKATDFSTVNNTLYPTVQAVNTQLDGKQDKPTEVYLTGSNQTNTSTTQQAILGLSATLSANSRYAVRISIRVGCSGSAGVNFAINIPSGATMAVNVYGFTTASTVDANQLLVTSGVNTGAAFCRLPSTSCMIDMYGTITTGATSGNADILFSSANGAQTSTIFVEGTYGTYTKFA